MANQKDNAVRCDSCGHVEERDSLFYITPCSNCGASGKYKTVTQITKQGLLSKTITKLTKPLR